MRQQEKGDLVGPGSKGKWIKKIFRLFWKETRLFHFLCSEPLKLLQIVASDSSDGPVLSLINKRLHGLRKKHNKILLLEETVAQGKAISEEQEEVLNSIQALRLDFHRSAREAISLATRLRLTVQEEVKLAAQSQ